MYTKIVPQEPSRSVRMSTPTDSNRSSIDFDNRSSIDFDNRSSIDFDNRLSIDYDNDFEEDVDFEGDRDRDSKDIEIETEESFEMDESIDIVDTAPSPRDRDRDRDVPKQKQVDDQEEKSSSSSSSSSSSIDTAHVDEVTELIFEEIFDSAFTSMFEDVQLRKSLRAENKIQLSNSTSFSPRSPRTLGPDPTSPPSGLLTPPHSGLLTPPTVSPPSASNVTVGAPSTTSILSPSPSSSLPSIFGHKSPVTPTPDRSYDDDDEESFDGGVISFTDESLLLGDDDDSTDQLPNNEIHIDQDFVRDYVFDVLDRTAVFSWSTIDKIVAAKKSTLKSSLDNVPQIPMALSTYMDIERNRGSSNENQQIYVKLLFDGVNQVLEDLVDRPLSQPRSIRKQSVQDVVLDRVLKWIRVGTAVTNGQDDVTSLLLKDQLEGVWGSQNIMNAISGVNGQPGEEDKIKKEIENAIFDDLLLDTVVSLNLVESIKQRRLRGY